MGVFRAAILLFVLAAVAECVRSAPADEVHVDTEDLAPGAADRLGLGSDELRGVKPELIHVSISGYGPGGPYSAKKAYVPGRDDLTPHPPG